MTHGIFTYVPASANIVIAIYFHQRFPDVPNTVSLNNRTHFSLIHFTDEHVKQYPSVFEANELSEGNSNAR